MAHVPVLLKPLTDFLLQRKLPRSPVFVDGTFGNGGYTTKLLEVFPSATLFCIDRDPLAISRATLLAANNNIVPLLGNFSACIQNLPQKVDGIFLDLGLSSMQIDDPLRGFSFRNDGPLDMRMSCHHSMHSLASSDITCEAIVNSFSAAELENIFVMYGEERLAAKYAREICQERAKYHIGSTLQLANIIAKAATNSKARYTAANYSHHPATRVFQALRIYINDELGQLNAGLRSCEQLLKPNGILGVVSFHSLEDRLVKRFMNSCALGVPFDVNDRGEKTYKSLQHTARMGPKIRQLEYADSDNDISLEELSDSNKCLNVNDSVNEQVPSFDVIKGVIRPSAQEVYENKRSRSAKLRLAIRTSSPALNTV